MPIAHGRYAERAALSARARAFACAGQHAGQQHGAAYPGGNQSVADAHLSLTPPLCVSCAQAPAMAAASITNGASQTVTRPTRDTANPGRHAQKAAQRLLDVANLIRRGHFGAQLGQR
jgi:hypothetical protein